MVKKAKPMMMEGLSITFHNWIGNLPDLNNICCSEFQHKRRLVDKIYLCQMHERKFCGIVKLPGGILLLSFSDKGALLIGTLLHQVTVGSFVSDSWREYANQTEPLSVPSRFFTLELDQRAPTVGPPAKQTQAASNSSQSGMLGLRWQ